MYVEKDKNLRFKEKDRVGFLIIEKFKYIF